MPTFTFAFDLYGRPNGQEEADFSDRAAAISAARRALEQRVVGIKAGVAVAHGAAAAEDVELLGRWDWSAQDGSRWTSQS
jgi:hypothetical protein